MMEASPPRRLFARSMAFALQAGLALSLWACEPFVLSPHRCGSTADCHNSTSQLWQCREGRCVCPAPYQPCERADIAEGYLQCVDAATDERHCGGCGQLCKDGEQCDQGACVPSCPQGQSVCEGQCVDLQRDEKHCGRCGLLCPKGQSCLGGICGLRCPAGQTACSAECVHLQQDPRHCGKCGTVCVGQQSECRAGRCRCPGDTQPCGAICLEDPRSACVDTFAGTGAAPPGTSTLVDGPKGQARFSAPVALAVDPKGRLYVSDKLNRSIRRVATDGSTLTLANGQKHSDGLRDPAGLAWGKGGALYAADASQHVILRLVVAEDPQQVKVSIFAGTAGQGGYRDGAAAQAQFLAPEGLAFDATAAGL